MKKLLNIFGGNRHKPDSQALSAFLDRRLTANENAAVEAHVTSCEACRAHLGGLQDVRATLRAMPQTEAPRSFRVRQADVEATPNQGAPAAAPWTRALPAFGGLAAAIFVVAVAVDVRSSGGGSPGEPQTTALRTSAEIAEASRPAGGIAGDAGSESGGQAYDSADAPAPAAPEDGAPEAGADGDNRGAGAVTSAAPPSDDTGLNAGTASPDVEAARDASSGAEDGGWPLSRYIAIVAAIGALAATGAWLGFRVERRRS